MKTPLFDGLIKYKDENVVRFHMPGHYGKDKFTRKIKDKLFDIDVTEVSGTDNLAEPRGIIKNSLEEISKIYNAKKSFYLVNGSTSGIYVAIDSLTDIGDEIIIARNSHKSVYNICRKKNLRMKFIYPKLDEEFGVDKGLDIEDVKKALEKTDAKVLVLTYPNYYGRAFDIKSIYEYVKQKNMFLIVDSAHGSAFAFSEILPDEASRYSDICIYSLHKTLPAFTQISLLTTNERVCEYTVEENVKFYTTTSPSYLLMTSGELAIKTMAEEQESIFRIKSQYEKAVKKLEENNIKVYKDDKQDFFKLFLKTAISGEILDKILREEFKIQCEMSIGNNILFMLGIAHTDEEIEYLVESVIKAVEKTREEENKNINFIPRTKMSEVHKNGNKKIVEIEFSKDMICSKDIIPYPPGIPLIINQEIINQEIIDTCKILGIKEIEVYE